MSATIRPFSNPSIEADIEQRLDEALLAVSNLSYLVQRERGKVPSYYALNRAWHELRDARRWLSNDTAATKSTP